MSLAPYPRDESLFARFERVASSAPDAAALQVEGGTWSYAELLAAALRLAEGIREGAATEERSPVAILAERSATAYLGLLAAFATARPYVPLLPSLPTAALRKRLVHAAARTLVVAAEGEPQAKEIVAALAPQSTLVLPSHGAVPGWVGRHAHLRVLTTHDLERMRPLSRPAAAAENDGAYLLFTSGTTGEPKGVLVCHGNLQPYVESAAALSRAGVGDRFSQHPDWSFDVSIHEIWSCWSSGGCLCVVPKAALFAPADFIARSELTHWTSVPSVVSFMRRLGMLTPRAFPSVRCTVFCGEALTQENAEAWQSACPNSEVFNFYGPTEATIAITQYRWDPARSAAECRHGLVPIGRPLRGQHVAVATEAGGRAAEGEAGELWLSGSQVCAGYWRNEEETARRFVRDAWPGSGRRWYRTGDRVVQDGDGPLHYLGRLDQQIKIRGHRVELAEVEHAVRQVADAAFVAVIGWPRTLAGADGLVAFVGRKGVSVEPILEHCRQELPAYMVPDHVLALGEVPLNANGKIDRRKLEEMATEELARGSA